MEELQKLASARHAAYEAAERNGSMEADLEVYWETVCGDVHLARKIISESGCEKNEIVTLAQEALRFCTLLEGFDHYLDRVNYALGRMSACLNDQPKLKRDMLRLRLTVLHRIEAQSGHEHEEYYIEELESKLLDYEMKYKYINFASVRAHPENYPEHEEYIRIYNLLSNRKSFIISNYAIYSPLFEDYSKIFNFDYMRVNKPTDIYPLEEYIIISLSEFDKEYNSHDDKKIVGEDGAATFFSTVSHDLKRHAKIFVDYQLRQQVPLRIRGNAEYFINIKDRKKKYPILLMVYYLPFKGLYKLTKHYIKKYESKKKRITKKSLRTGQAIYKRNDITLPYAILRSLASGLKRICDWFDQFYYFKLSTTISQEDENDTATKGKKKSLCINIRDLTYKNQHLYDSTFLSFSYEQKKNKEFKDLDTFTKLSPPKEELDKCNSRFYNKINGK